MEVAPESGDRARIDTMRRRRLFRDLLAFQAKLLIDALKDVLLSPLAIGAAIMDFISPNPRLDRGRGAAAGRVAIDKESGDEHEGIGRRR